MGVHIAAVAVHHPEELSRKRVDLKFLKDVVHGPAPLIRVDDLDAEQLAGDVYVCQGAGIELD